MKKVNLSVALLAAVSLAIAASPSEAAAKKKAKSSKPQAAQSQAIFASHFNSCASTTSRMWIPVAAVGAISCGVVYAVPVTIEGFLMPRRA